MILGRAGWKEGRKSSGPGKQAARGIDRRAAARAFSPRYDAGVNDVIRTLRRHRSIRRFSDAPVHDDDLRAAVAAGQAASTSSAVQAYAAIRVRDAATRGALADLAGGQTKVERCGAFLVICADARRHRLVAERAGAAWDARLESFLLGVVDATLFAQNLVVALESMDYGICYIGGLRNRIADVAALLELPEGVHPLYGLCVGIPAESPDARPRLPLEAVLLEERYPDDATMLARLDDYDATYRDYLERRGAEPRDWSDVMARKFSHPERVDLADAYRAQGARLD